MNKVPSVENHRNTHSYNANIVLNNVNCLWAVCQSRQCGI